MMPILLHRMIGIEGGVGDLNKPGTVATLCNYVAHQRCVSAETSLAPLDAVSL